MRTDVLHHVPYLPIESDIEVYSNSSGFCPACTLARRIAIQIVLLLSRDDHPSEFVLIPAGFSAFMVGYSCAGSPLDISCELGLKFYWMCTDSVFGNQFVPGRLSLYQRQTSPRDAVYRQKHPTSFPILAHFHIFVQASGPSPFFRLDSAFVSCGVTPDLHHG